MKWLIVPTLVLAALKLWGVIELDWLWVTMPIWILPLMFVTIEIVSLMLIMLLAIMKSDDE